MKFLFSFLILFITIISNKLFLFNEEFLILISFIGFSFAIYNRISPNINLHFKDKTSLIKTSLIVSLDSIIDKLDQKKELNDKINNLRIIFSSLKVHYLTLSTKFFNYFLIYLDNKEKNNLIFNLETLKRLEKDYAKFILLLVNQKLGSINNLLFFFSSKFQIKQFKLINKINRLVLIKKI